MQKYQYLLITGGIALGLAGGITIGVSAAEDIRGVVNMPQEFMLKVAGTDTQQPIIPMDQIIAEYEKNGQRVTEVQLDREYMRDIYEIELVDTTGRELEIDIDAHTGEVLKRKVDRD